MKWSWRLGQVSGIGVYVHATFLLIVLWVAMVHWVQQRSAAGVASAVLFILAIFACVVLHELGHALAAQRYGIATRDITLLPIGGVARLERMPDEPRQELWVALAGPLVSLVIAFGLFVGLQIRHSLIPLSEFSFTQGSFIERLMLVNVFIAFFNLLPAFPMDGGRVVRALLATRLEYTRATQLAASIGQAMALFFGFAGLLGNPFLLFIAFFVWIGAAQEAAMVQMRSALGGIPVAQATITDFRTLSPHDPLTRAVDMVLEGFQQDFPVVDEGRVVGILTRGDLLLALAREGRDRLVSDVMRRDFQAVDAFDMLESAMERLQECQCRTLPVLHRGELIGLVTMDNVGEFVMFRSAMARERAGI
ncbi:MAG: site-2 protease family protein [Armatimonadota bacterium]|nr:site-2 protease family protein [Armatimonadota bacterium]